MNDAECRRAGGAWGSGVLALMMVCVGALPAASRADETLGVSAQITAGTCDVVINTAGADVTAPGRR
ncbi:hypothetical protein D3C86_1865500 [compost metagenome]